MQKILSLLIIILFIQCSDNNTKLVDPVIIGQLNKEINERINIINQNVELTINGGSMDLINPNEIDKDVNRLLEKFNSDAKRDSTIRQTNEFFKNITKRYWLKVIDFIEITPYSNFELSVKLNELTLLDEIIFNRKNKIGTSCYQTKFIPTTQTDSTYSGEVIFLKTDTLFPPEVLVTSMEEYKDTVHLRILNGRGTFEMGIANKPYDFSIKGAVKCNGQFFKYEFNDHVK